MTSKLKITDPAGNPWELQLEVGKTYTIGRSKDCDIVLNDRRVSRKHAHILGDAEGFHLIDGYYEDGLLKRSVNHVFVNGSPVLEKALAAGDVIMGVDSVPVANDGSRSARSR